MTLLDRNGRQVTAGDRVRFRFRAIAPGEWFEGVVRDLGPNGANCDDGRPDDPNPLTNGATAMCVVHEPERIEVLDQRSTTASTPTNPEPAAQPAAPRRSA